MWMLEKIRDNVASNRDRKAFVSRAGTITYGELWDRSEQLAVSLNDRLKNNKDPIVVYGHKDPWMLVCFLACAKTGRAYCPVDVSMPRERIDQIIDTVDNETVLAVEPLETEKYTVIGKDEIMRMADGNGTVPMSGWSDGDDVYYMIFTSGSTGRPKGVMVTADNISDFAQWVLTLGKDGEDMTHSVFLNQAPYSFDLSNMDAYPSLCSAGTSISLDKELQQDTGALLEYLKDAKLNYWVSTPSFANMCLADRAFNGNDYPDLKAFLFCGETLTKKTAGELMKRFPDARVINTYGPTEATVAVTSVEITEEMIEAEDSLPIGIVREGTDIAIDNDEIIIYGRSVGLGYYKNKEKTEAVFGVSRDKSGCERRSYRTGDKGYFKDGYLYYCGRLDMQIKLHGYRIELGDIENNLLSIPGVSEAAVIPCVEDGLIKHLAAFVVAHELKGDFKDRQFIKNSLREVLPDYMVPKKVTFIDAMPVNVNNKIDRKRLGDWI